MSSTRQPRRGTGARERRRASRWNAGLVIALFVLTLARASGSGGISDTIPTDWVAVTPGPGAEIVQFIKDLPHDRQSSRVPRRLINGRRRLRRHSGPSGFRPSTGRRWPGSSGWALRPMRCLGPESCWSPVSRRRRTTSTSLSWRICSSETAGTSSRSTCAGTGSAVRCLPAMITGGWKEAGDIARRGPLSTDDESGTTSVAVIGFSDGGRSLVKAMEGEGAADIAAGIAVTAPFGPTTPMTPPPPGTLPTPLNEFFRTFLGTSSDVRVLRSRRPVLRRRSPHDGGADGRGHRHRAGQGAAPPALRDGRYASGWAT